MGISKGCVLFYVSGCLSDDSSSDIFLTVERPRNTLSPLCSLRLWTESDDREYTHWQVHYFFPVQFLYTLLPPTPVENAATSVSTSTSASSAIRGTTRWLAPELLFPDHFALGLKGLETQSRPHSPPILHADTDTEVGDGEDNSDEDESGEGDVTIRADAVAAGLANANLAANGHVRSAGDVRRRKKPKKAGRDIWALGCTILEVSSIWVLVPVHE
jgi:hypothetical protein